MSSSTNSKTTGNGLLRVVGALLSLASAILAILGMIFQHSILSLIFSGFIILFAVRVFVLWLGNNRATTAQGTAARHMGPMQQPVTYPSTPYAHYSQEPRPLTPTGSFPPMQAANAASNQGNLPVTPTSTMNNANTQYDGGMVYAAASSNSPQPSYPPVAPGSSYPAAPAYAFQASYAQGQTAPQEGSQRTSTGGPFVPIEQDPLFALDAPSGNERCFMLAKEGEPLVECQDRYALHSANRCYAVADGVAGSFVPGPWARIVAKGFVERCGKFANKDDFQGWLLACGREWQSWIETRWIPTINALRERNGERPGDWNDDLRQGAQTTLIGCSLFSNTEQHDAATSATVFAVGDSEFFLFSPNPSGGYEIAETFPFSDPNEFSVRPDTLVTVQRTDLLERAWVQRKTMHINVFSGDVIVLASDALAKWLLTQVYQQSNKWLPLLTSRSAAEFEQYVRSELQQGLIEDDDVTMLVIPIP